MALNPALITGGADLIGTGLDFYGAQKDRRAAQDANNANVNAQKEFAQMGIRWRVADARAAGINPLYALGASVTPFSASVMPESSGDSYRAIGQGLRGMGQNVARAVQATQTQEEREFNKTANILELENRKLQNEILKKRLNMTNVDQPSNPPFPDGFGNTGMGGQSTSIKDPPMSIVPVGRSAHGVGDSLRAYGSITENIFKATPTGLKIVPSPDMAGTISNDMLEWLKYHVSTKVRELVDPYQFQPSTIEFPLPKGHDWWWNPWAQEFQPREIESNWWKRNILGK